MASPSQNNRDSYIDRLDEYYGLKNRGNISGVTQKAETSRTRFQYSEFKTVCLNIASWIVGFSLTLAVFAGVVVLCVGFTSSRSLIKQTYERGLETIGEIEKIRNTIRDYLTPQVALINTVVSYTIPTILSQIRKDITSSISRSPTVVFEYQNNTCPKVPRPTHSIQYKEFNPDILTRCSQRGFSVQVDGDILIREMPSFIPTQTKVQSCSRMPSFSISPTIWAYSHSIMRAGCVDEGPSDQYFAVGIIDESWRDVPHFETLYSWYMNDNAHRKHCSVAAGEFGAWIGCVIVKTSFGIDFCTPGIQPLFIAYMDVYGRKRFWLYEEKDLSFRGQLNACYFAIGAGVVVEGRVYLPVQGATLGNETEGSYCYAPRCDRATNDECNQASALRYTCGRPIINGIISFDDDYTQKPQLKLIMFNRRSHWMGSEMRIIHNYNLGLSYIYTKSGSWHTWPQLGLINLKNPSQIVWVDNSAVSRPSWDTCPGGNSCPKQCVGGIYNDIYPLGRYYEFGATVYLDSNTQRIKPTIALVNTTSIFKSTLLTSANQLAAGSTTTCFVFMLKPWCVSIVELSPSIVGLYGILPFTYTLPLVCSSSYQTANQIVGDNRESIRINIPQRNQQAGTIVNLGELREQWPELRSEIPSLQYPSVFRSSSTDLFEYDNLVNPYYVRPPPAPTPVPQPTRDPLLIRYPPGYDPQDVQNAETKISEGFNAIKSSSTTREGRMQKREELAHVLMSTALALGAVNDVEREQLNERERDPNGTSTAGESDISSDIPDDKQLELKAAEEMKKAIVDAQEKLKNPVTRRAAENELSLKIVSILWKYTRERIPLHLRDKATFGVEGRDSPQAGSTETRNMIADQGSLIQGVPGVAVRPDNAASISTGQASGQVQNSSPGNLNIESESARAGEPGTPATETQIAFPESGAPGPS
ncbi:cell attachment protein [memana virus]|uniref:Cell attachment protein n=1 Tax=memana virus TaxID=2940997 RepID=A0AAE9KXC2_9MONO|nr:cell attachment protein [memana virus]